MQLRADYTVATAMNVIREYFSLVCPNCIIRIALPDVPLSRVVSREVDVCRYRIK